MLNFSQDIAINRFFTKNRCFLHINSRFPAYNTVKSSMHIIEEKTPTETLQASVHHRVLCVTEPDIRTGSLLTLTSVIVVGVKETKAPSISRIIVFKIMVFNLHE